MKVISFIFIWFSGISLNSLGPNLCSGYAVGQHAFLLAAETGNVEVMRFLDKLDSELKNAKNDDGDTALTLAAWKADKKTVQFLIETLNMNPQEKGHNGRNAFLRALSSSNFEVMKYLDDLDLKLKYKKDKDGNNALTLAVWVNLDILKTVKFLVEDLKMNTSIMNEEYFNYDYQHSHIIINSESRARLYCETLGSEWSVKHVDVKGSLYCLKGTTPTGSDCNSCDTYRIVVWKDGAGETMNDSGSYPFNTVAGTVYGGHKPCKKGSDTLTEVCYPV